MAATEHAFRKLTFGVGHRRPLRRWRKVPGRAFSPVHRAWLAVVLTILVAGCASRKPLAPDPFFGPTAVPPPATGCAQGPRDSYLATSEKIPTPSEAADNAAGNAAGAAPVVAWSPASAPTTVGAIGDSRGARSTTAAWETGPTASGAIRTRIRPPDYSVAAAPQPAATPVSTPAAADASLSMAPAASATPLGGAAESPAEPVVCVIHPMATGRADRSDRASPSPAGVTSSVVPASGSTWTARAGETPPASAAIATAPMSNVSTGAGGPVPRRIVLPNRVIDIMDLPDASGNRSRPYRADPRVRAASATVPMAAAQPCASARGPARPVGGGLGQVAASNTGRVSASACPSLRYAYDPAYGWLRGRLEYSEVARRWKLRYIPIDGRVDSFGGSVVLGESTLLSGRQKGDFVEVHGRLLTGENGHWGYAPVYQVAQVQGIGR